MRTLRPIFFALLAVPSGAALLVACDKAPESKPEQAAEPAESAEAEVAPAENAEVAANDDEVVGECLHGKAHSEGGCGGADAVPANGTEGHFGSPFALASAQPLAQAVSVLDGASTVQVSGEVTSVCQAKGCWMVIKDHESDDVMARVLMKDHAFSVPMDGTGKKAVVEGELTEKTLSEGQVKHLAKDAGEDPAAVEGERKEYVLTASAVKLES